MITIDRIEGGFAVLEIAGTMVDVPLSALPAGAQEGDHLTLTPSEGDSSATAVHQDTVERVERLQAMDTGEMEIDI